MSEAKTPEDHRVIVYRILKKQNLPVDVISQIIINFDEGLRRLKEQTVHEILGSLSKTITVDQREEVIRVVRSA